MLMIGEIIKMCEKKGFRTDNNNLNESVLEHDLIIGERNTHFSVEPSNEKDYDIYLMTGNNGKGSEKK